MDFLDNDKEMFNRKSHLAPLENWFLSFYYMYIKYAKTFDQDSVDITFR